MATDLALPDELLDVPHKDGPQSELDYRASWVQTRLKFVGAINKQARCGSRTASDFALRAFCEVANPSSVPGGDMRLRRTPPGCRKSWLRKKIRLPA